jgi:hypothetical protein
LGYKNGKIGAAWAKIDQIYVRFGTKFCPNLIESSNENSSLLKKMEFNKTNFIINKS